MAGRGYGSEGRFWAWQVEHDSETVLRPFCPGSEECPVVIPHDPKRTIAIMSAGVAFDFDGDGAEELVLLSAANPWDALGDDEFDPWCTEARILDFDGGDHHGVFEAISDCQPVWVPQGAPWIGAIQAQSDPRPFDVDDDGRLDVLVIGYPDGIDGLGDEEAYKAGVPTVWFNDGGERLLAPRAITGLVFDMPLSSALPGRNPSKAMATGDLDHDGILDLVVPTGAGFDIFWGLDTHDPSPQ